MYNIYIYIYIYYICIIYIYVYIYIYILLWYPEILFRYLLYYITMKATAGIIILT